MRVVLFEMRFLFGNFFAQTLCFERLLDNPANYHLKKFVIFARILLQAFQIWPAHDFIRHVRSV